MKVSLPIHWATAGWIASVLAATVSADNHSPAIHDGNSHSQEGANPSSSASSSSASASISEEVLYTAFDDASWAITSPHLSQKLGPQKQALYDAFIQGCECEAADEDRLYQNQYQPPAMKNYTKLGFQKIRAPEELYKLLKDFWDANRDMAVDEWEETSTFHNLWEVPTKMVELQNTDLEGGGKTLAAAVWDAARDILQEWTGQTLVGTSVYGIRVYYNQSILTPHVDRLPLVSSAIINVDQDVDEPWFLEVYGHDGKATNVSMAPGDMVLYESHSVIHGRPFPMNGKFYANVFCHFEILEGSSKPGELPPYVLDGTEWAKFHREAFPEGYNVFQDMERLARDGELYGLKAVAKSDIATIKREECFIMRDAILYDHMNIIEWMLTEVGFDINKRCRRVSNRPGTVVDIAQDAINDHDADDGILKYLQEAGGKPVETLREEGVLDYYTADEDVSWAIQSSKLSSKLGNKQALYDSFIENCDGEEEENCAEHDQFRVEQNAIQPMSMNNYTTYGYKKIRAPESLFKLIKDFWDTNRGEAVEEWEESTSFHNLWEVPTAMVRLDNSSLTGGGMNLSAAIWNAGREILEDWTGEKLAGSSVYGVRVYYNRSILTPHVDRMPLVASAIINVDQDVDEPWYLEVYGHDGVATNVSMAPGDMVLYESGSVLHGRPFPMNGHFYANVFMHFEVMGDISEGLPASGGLPPYIVPETEGAESWLDEFEGWSLFTDIRNLAYNGDVYTMEIISEREPELITRRPCNAAIPAIHENQLTVIQFLIEEMELDVNMVCGKAEPGTLLEYAIESQEEEDDAIVEYLLSMGAVTMDDENFEGEMEDDEDYGDDEEEEHDEL